MTSGSMVVHSQSSGEEGKSKDLQGNKEEISYQRSNKGKMKPSLGLVASPGTEGGAMGTPTFVSADVMDPAAGVFGCSPMMSGGAEPVGGIKEEEAIGKKKKKWEWK
jgi:hypothetical protein